MVPFPFSWRIVALTFLFVGTLGCSTAQTAGPRAWFDTPLDGSTVSLGTPVAILSHSHAPDGVREVLVSVNGDPYWRGAPTKPGQFAETKLEWVPDQEGEYVLEVKAFAPGGASSPPGTVRVRVIGRATLVPSVVPPESTLVPAEATLVPGASDLAIVSVDAITAGYKNDVPFCNTRVVYSNMGTAAVPDNFTVQFHYNGTPQLANTVAGGLAPGATAELTFVYQFVGSPYIGINLDSTNVIPESDETNNAFANARLCGSASSSPSATLVWTPTIAPPSVVTHAPSPVPTVTPSPVPTATPTPVNTPWPKPNVNFRADKTDLAKGECTTLRWDVDYATAVFLDGHGIAGHGLDQVCPAKTTVYSLHVEAPAGNIDRSVTINIAADTDPPPVPTTQVPANGLTISCKSSQTLAWLPVTDPSGISGYYVKLERQITASNWQPVRTWGPVTDKQVSANVQCGVKYRWAVRSQDGAGNYSNWSGWSTFSIKLN